MQTIRSNTIKNTIIGLFTGAMLLAGGQAMAQERSANGLLSVDIHLGGGVYHEREQRREVHSHKKEMRHEKQRHTKPSQHAKQPNFHHQHNGYSHYKGKPYHDTKHHRDYRPAPHHRASPLLVLSHELFLAPWQNFQLRVILGDHWDGHMNRHEARRIHKMLTREQRRHWHHSRFYADAGWHHH